MKQGGRWRGLMGVGREDRLVAVSWSKTYLELVYAII
jgi:hypothetical protein